MDHVPFKKKRGVNKIMMKNGKVNHSLQTAYIRRYTLTDGTESGLKVIEMNNGAIRLLLNESKGLDIMQLWHRGTNISFVSKNGFTQRELPFATRFEGGMLYTCGIDSIGGREGYETHGTYHNTPSKIIQTVCNESILQVVAEIEDTCLFGRNLLIQRTITLPIDREEVTVEDVLINRGTKEENYCLLYHVNLGYPMLDEGAEIVGDFGDIVPRTKKSQECIKERNIFSQAKDNEEESCYFMEDYGETVSVLNRKIGKRFDLQYSKDTLPCFIQWNSPASQDYALGLEPATSYLDDRFAYKVIEPDEEIKFAINMSITQI